MSNTAAWPVVLLSLLSNLIFSVPSPTKAKASSPLLTLFLTKSVTSNSSHLFRYWILTVALSRIETGAKAGAELPVIVPSLKVLLGFRSIGCTLTTPAEPFLTDDTNTFSVALVTEFGVAGGSNVSNLNLRKPRRVVLPAVTAIVLFLPKFVFWLVPICT